jgi:hypothetical protein
VWRQDEQAGLSFALKLTAAGVRAIAIDDRSASDHTTEGDGGRVRVAAPSSEIVQRAIAEVPVAGAPSPSAPRGGTKLARVLELLQRDCGANARRTDRGDGLASAYHARRADRLAQARPFDNHRPIREGAGINIPRAVGRDQRHWRCRASKRLSAGNLRYPQIEEGSTRGEAARATSSVMLRERHYATSERASLSRRRRRATPKRSTRLSRVSLISVSNASWTRPDAPPRRRGCR